MPPQQNLYNGLARPANYSYRIKLVLVGRKLWWTSAFSDKLFFANKYAAAVVNSNGNNSDSNKHYSRLS